MSTTSRTSWRSSTSWSPATAVYCLKVSSAPLVTEAIDSRTAFVCSVAAACLAAADLFAAADFAVVDFVAVFFAAVDFLTALVLRATDVFFAAVVFLAAVFLVVAMVMLPREVSRRPDPVDEATLAGSANKSKHHASSCDEVHAGRP